MNLPRCECGCFHAPAAKYCERCGAQPPRPRGTGRQDEGVDAERMSDAEAEEFVSFALAVNVALLGTGGKWGVA